jgi:hypothetical protein
VQSCQSPSADAAAAPPSAPALEPRDGGAAVTAAKPGVGRRNGHARRADRGSGFDKVPCELAVERRHVSQIAVNRTSSSASSVIANITVAQDAAAVTYDIVVGIDW